MSTFDDQTQSAYLNVTVFQPGDAVITRDDANPPGKVGRVVSFIPISTHGLPGYNVDWLDGTNSDVLASRLRRP